MPTPLLIGPERTLSSDWGLTNAFLGSVTALANGSFLTTLGTATTSGTAISGYVFTHRADGLAAGQIALNAQGGAQEGNWMTSALADGGFVVAWDDDIPGPPYEQYVHAGIYNANGGIRVPSFAVNDVLTKADYTGAVTALEDGSFAVFYMNNATSDGEDDLFVRTFSSNGAALGAGIRVSTVTAGDQDSPSAAALKGGGLVVVYEDSSLSGDHADGITVRGKVIVNGTMSAEFHVPETPGGNQYDPQVAVLADGRFVVTWTNSDRVNPEDGDNASVCARIYNADGTPATHQFRINTTTVWEQHQSSVTALKNGGFAVAFTNVPTTVGDDGDIMVQLFTASGEKDGAEIRVNTTTRGHQTNPVIAELADGRLVVSWDDQPVDYASSNVRSQILDPRSTGAVLKGTAGADEYVGSAFADKMNGGLGNDVLTGGAGRDVFVFSTKLGTYKTNKTTNFDKILDFNVKDDSIWLDNAVFKKLGKGTELKPGKLKKDFFATGTKAADVNDYLVYNKKTGVLSYDADGSGKGKAIEFAQLQKNLKLTDKDFFII